MFLVLLFLFGGTSQDIELTYFFLEIISIICVMFGLIRLSHKDVYQVRPFVIVALLLIALPALQLIPLPPEIWSALPGRDLYHQALGEVGLADVWRPISLSPDRTVRSLLALLPVLAAALLFAPLDHAGRVVLLNVLLACFAVSAVVAVSQIATQQPYFFEVTNRGSGVGFFANRNHQALFIAIVVLLIIARWRLAELGGRRLELGAIAAGSLFLIFPLLLVTGSRSGLLTGILAFVAGSVVFLRQVLMRQPAGRRWIILAVALALAAGAVTLTLYSSRLTALDRLLTSDSSDLRVVNLPAVLTATQNFFPFGTGFGTFDPVFRQFEPYENLNPAFFNHAHNDLVEIILEGGMFALALLIAFIALFSRKARILWTPVAGSTNRILAKAGYLGLLLLGIGSLVDYPLRTPFMAVLAMLLATWCFTSEEGTGANLGNR